MVTTETFTPNSYGANNLARALDLWGVKGIVLCTSWPCLRSSFVRPSQKSMLV